MSSKTTPTEESANHSCTIACQDDRTDHHWLECLHHTSQEMTSLIKLLAKHLNAYGLEDGFITHEHLGRDGMITAAYIEGIPESLTFIWGDRMITDPDYDPEVAEEIIDCLESGGNLGDLEGFDEDELIQEMTVIRPYQVEMEVNGSVSVVDCRDRYDARERAECFVHAFDGTSFDASATIRRNVPSSVCGISDPEKLCTFVNVYRPEVCE